MGTDARERAPLPTGVEARHDTPSHVIADQAAPEERSTNTEVVLVVPRTNKELLYETR